MLHGNKVAQLCCNISFEPDCTVISMFVNFFRKRNIIICQFTNLLFLRFYYYRTSMIILTITLLTYLFHFTPMWKHQNKILFVISCELTFLNSKTLELRCTLEIQVKKIALQTRHVYCIRTPSAGYPTEVRMLFSSRPSELYLWLGHNRLFSYPYLPHS